MLFRYIFLGVLVFFSMTSLGFSAADADSLFGTEKITNNLRNGGNDLVLTADNVLGFLVGLLYFIAVVVAIYAGFTILTSGGDEERVKKGKKILIYALVGLIVIFLASQIVTWVIDVMGSEEIVGP